MENFFMTTMTILSVGFTILMFSVITVEYFRILFSELFDRSKSVRNRFDK